MPLRQRFREPDSYGLLLLLIGVALATAAFAGQRPAGVALVAVMEGAVLLFAFKTSRTPPGVHRAALFVTPIVVVVVAALTGVETEVADAVIAVSLALLAAGAIGAIVRRLAAHPRVDGSTILGALSSYVLFGMFFSFVFTLVDAVGDGPFFVGEAAPRSVDFLYFSFVTLATLGYGDLTAASDVGRMLAIAESLTGQLYLVTVVALVVANLGRERRGA